MKIAQWMSREKLDDRAVAERLTTLDPSFHCSVHGVSKWRLGVRMPRGRALALLSQLTDGEVTANDFVSGPAANDEHQREAEVA